VATAYAISELIRTPVMLWFATRVGPVSFPRIRSAILPFLLAAPLCFLIVLSLRWTAGGTEHPFLFVLTATIAAYAAALPCLMINRAGRLCLAEMRHLLATGRVLVSLRLGPTD
jgi:PST family polysaccharide transporter